MPTGYPGALDTYPNPTATTLMDDPSFPHAQGTSNLGDGLEAVMATLGVNPQGGSATVKARLDAVDTAIAARALAAEKAAPSGIATLDASSKLVQAVDAGNISSGILAAARIPDLDAAKIATGTLADARIPNLNASKTNAGVFAIARIPDLDAAKITTGVLAAGRIPSSVASNSNARVVADIPGRDAIPAGDRVDGMWVYAKSPASWWMWRADNSTWQLISLRIRASSAISTTLDGAYSNVTGWSFPAMAGLSYDIDLDLFMDNTGTASADMKFGLSWTGAGNGHLGVLGADASLGASTSVSTITGQAVVSDNTSPLDNPAIFGLNNNVPMTGFVRATFECTTSGTVQVRFAQGTTNASFASRILPGSRMRVESS